MPAEDQNKSIDNAEEGSESVSSPGRETLEGGVLGSLLPRVDFDSIPLTQPKRVLAKSHRQQASEERSLDQLDDPIIEPPPPTPKGKKKPASLLDSYFKGL